MQEQLVDLARRQVHRVTRRVTTCGPDRRRAAGTKSSSRRSARRTSSTCPPARRTTQPGGASASPSSGAADRTTAARRSTGVAGTVATTRAPPRPAARRRRRPPPARRTGPRAPPGRRRVALRRTASWSAARPPTRRLVVDAYTSNAQRSPEPRRPDVIQSRATSPADASMREGLCLAVVRRREADHRIGQADQQAAGRDARGQPGRGAGRRSIDLGRRLGRKECRGAGSDVDLDAEMIAAHQAAAVGRGEHPGRLTSRRRREPFQRALGVGPRDVLPRGPGDTATTPRRSAGFAIASTGATAATRYAVPDTAWMVAPPPHRRRPARCHVYVVKISTVDKIVRQARGRSRRGTPGTCFQAKGALAKRSEPRRTTL